MEQETYKEDCIFCQIVAGGTPAQKIYEDDTAISFLDIRPVNEGHALVVPKGHSDRFDETSDGTLSALLPVAKKIGLALKKAIGADGFNIMINNGAAAGEIVSHTHVHVIPRSNTDGLANWPGESYKEGEAEKVAEKIKAAL
jgi:histidine triad (HIT) family protein